MTTKEMFENMFKMQDRLNEEMIPNWRDANLPWHRYIWTECAEAMDSLDFKHWKHKEPDYDNLKVEMVDVIHFGLSALLQDGMEHDVVELAQIEYSYSGTYKLNNDTDVMHVLDNMVLSTPDEQLFYVLDIWHYLGGTVETLYKAYMVKNILNYFRKSNGYKTGEYKKLWNGEEDNVVAYRIAEELAAEELEHLPGRLQEVYNAVG